MAKEQVEESTPAVEETEGKEGETGKNSDLDERIKAAMAPVLKKLEETEKDNSGKTRKINELIEEKKKLQQSTMSQEELMKVQAQELEDERRALETQKKDWEVEQSKKEYKLMKLEALLEVEGFPVAKHGHRVNGETREEIIADAKLFMKEFLTEVKKRDNARIISAPPQTGNGKQVKITADQYASLPKEEQQAWTDAASDEDIINMISSAEQ